MRAARGKGKGEGEGGRGRDREGEAVCDNRINYPPMGDRTHTPRYAGVTAGKGLHVGVCRVLAGGVNKT